MSVSFWVGPKRFEVGSPSFLKAFFSTVFVRLESERWGTRYPIVMQHLYSGVLGYEKAALASNEVTAIREA